MKSKSSFWAKCQFRNKKSVNYEFPICLYIRRYSPRGALANALDCDIVVSEFELQSCYYVHFQINTLGKGMKSFFPLSMG